MVEDGPSCRLSRGRRFLVGSTRRCLPQYPTRQPRPYFEHGWETGTVSVCHPGRGFDQRCHLHRLARLLRELEFPPSIRDRQSLHAAGGSPRTGRWHATGSLDRHRPVLERRAGKDTLGQHHACHQFSGTLPQPPAVRGRSRGHASGPDDRSLGRPSDGHSISVPSRGCRTWGILGFGQYPTRTGTSRS